MNGSAGRLREALASFQESAAFWHRHSTDEGVDTAAALVRSETWSAAYDDLALRLAAAPTQTGAEGPALREAVLAGLFSASACRACGHLVTQPWSDGEHTIDCWAVPIIAAALRSGAEVAAAPGLDVERRLYLLSRLVMIAYSEMPERLNNRTRVNVNHAAAVADQLRGHSCGECDEIAAEYARRR